MVCRPYPFKFFKGCLPQTLLGPFLNTWSPMETAFPKQIRHKLKLVFLRSLHVLNNDPEQSLSMQQKFTQPKIHEIEQLKFFIIDVRLIPK